MIEAKDVTAVILAAGNSTRMKSSVSKVLHEIACQPMLEYVLKTAQAVASSSIVVANKHLVQQHEFQSLASNYQFITSIQENPLGTADALRAALDQIHSRYTVVLYGDVPLITDATIYKMYQELGESNQLIILAFDCLFENSYGKIVLDQNNIPSCVIEDEEADIEQKKITLCNAGTIVVETEALKDFFNIFSQSQSDTKQYLTHLVEFFYKHKNQNIRLIKFSNHDELMGINDRSQLAHAENVIQNRLRTKFLIDGVSMIDPKSVYISASAQISNDVTIYPYVFIGKDVKIDSNVTLLSFSHLEGVTVESNVIIGPFARIRPQTRVASHSKIGNFVEVKNSVIGQHTKISHLAYVGDATLGDAVNIGAGSIFCNYDGKNKHRTTIGNNTFIGSNTALVAPLEVGEEVLIGAGSTITQNIPSHHISIARSRQTNVKKKTTLK